jgi:HlyD family secretion protein
MLEQHLQSQAEFDAKQTAWQVEEARHKSALEQVEQARAALKQARDDLSKTTIYAPMSGTVSALNKEVGEIALGSQFQADVIMVIADLREMEAQVNVGRERHRLHPSRAGRRGPDRCSTRTPLKAR